MNQQLQPYQQVAQVSPANVVQLGQQLIQALSTIATTQQEILNRLATTPAPSASGGQPEVPTYTSWGNHWSQQYQWLRAYGLTHNLDGTRKRQTVTTQDI